MRSRFVMFPLPFFFSLHFLVEVTTMFCFCFCRFGCYFSFSGVLLPHFFKCVTGCVWSYPEYCNEVYCIALFYCTLPYLASLYFTLVSRSTRKHGPGQGHGGGGVPTHFRENGGMAAVFSVLGARANGAKKTA